MRSALDSFPSHAHTNALASDKQIYKSILDINVKRYFINSHN